MKRARILVLLLAVLPFLAGCPKAPDTSSTTTTTTPEASTEKKPLTVICIEAKDPDVRETVIQADKKQEVAWKGHDAAYTLYFAEDQWEFSEDADGEEATTGATLKKIEVPKGGLSRTFTLKYKLDPGARKEHHYRVDYNPPTGVMDPPNGPAIIGEG